jgi:2-succinyl-5-enolpyruvyl-6-hydroxy-3-cyclohexene-1-carboxylate synthase
MKKHYDICVAGFWYGSNYGSLLNGYAEYRLLKSFGNEVLMLQKPGASSDDTEISQGHNVLFVQKYYDAEDISPVLPYDKLSTLNDICDCFCAGSDQIWNYTLSFHENLYLPFAGDDKKLISFATSFGHKKDKVLDASKPRIRKYLQRYSAISVREQFDVDILRENYGINGTLVFEPVFCLDKTVYDDLAADSSFAESEPYMLTYILDPTPEKREAILYYGKKLGLKAVNLLSGVKSVFSRNRDLLNLPNMLENVDAGDFIKAFMDAEYIITDSFHGTSFAVIFNKPFLAIGNYGRGYDRFIDLLGRLKLSDRLVDPRNIPQDAKYLKPIDYAETNKIIDEKAKKTVEWLRWAIETPKDRFSKVAFHNIYPDFERTRVLVSLIRQYGIKHIVMSSGTRNVSIARMFEGNPDFFQIYNVTDERSAAYFAIGLSTKLQETVAICCTSGTAASNYVPGVTEAYHQNIPLLVITADRHPSLHGNLEDQTIAQYGLFSTITKKAITLPVNENVNNMWDARVKICDVLLAINHHGKGPVQINVPQAGIEMIPSPKYSLVLPDVRTINRIVLGDKSDVWKSELSVLINAKRVMVVPGQNEPLSDSDRLLFDKFTENYNCVVLVDYLSNYQGVKSVFPYRLLKKMSQQDYDRFLTPDLVIQLGGKRILNCPLTAKLRGGSNNIKLWRVAEDGKVADLYRRLTTVWECSTRQFLEYALSKAPGDASNDSLYYAKWAEYIEKLPPENPQNWNSYYTLFRMTQVIPKHSLVHLSVGHTFTHVQNFVMDRSIEVFCNMGTNGIDGCSSSFMGQAQVASEDQLCFLFVGDLSFFYDMNSIWNKKLKGNIQILLNNDGGAGLLRYLRSPALTQEHCATAVGWVKSLGFEYMSATTKDEFEANLARFADPNIKEPMFFEVFVP